MSRQYPRSAWLDAPAPRYCERSEAIQRRDTGLDSFVALLLAMTGKPSLQPMDAHPVSRQRRQHALRRQRQVADALASGVRDGVGDRRRRRTLRRLAGAERFLAGPV